jgi:inner membrane protein
MDSLTQIILGAACGEVVAGKKLGNRAMLWGGIGGTIPDLDVFATFFTDEITATAFHRGFMHSFLFAALAPWLLAWLTLRFYGGGVYQRPAYKAVAALVWLLLFAGAAFGINSIPVLISGSVSWYILVPTLALGGWFVWKLWQDYWRSDLNTVAAPYRTWVALFFWSIFTHPVLDCFTSWGTQIWQPFSDMRVQWCTVSVVDPLCSVPFMLALIVASWYARGNRMRAVWNYVGLVWFCGYLCIYTVWHKMQVNDIFKESLAARHISWSRIYTNPTILNNIVWSGVAEGDTAYYFGQYGFNDRTRAFTKISTIPKNHNLLAAVPPDSKAGYFLRWFSDGYYSVQPYRGDTLQVNDLRFGLLGDSLRNNNYVFPFMVYKNEKGEWDVHQDTRNRANMDMQKKALGDMWRRIMGDK